MLCVFGQEGKETKHNKQNEQQGEAFKSTEEGAATTVWCAVSPLLEGEGGVYCEDCEVAVAADPEKPRAGGYYPHIRDEDLAGKLWTKSEAMTGVSFPA